MPKYRIYEWVPTWVGYYKIIEAENLEEAQNIVDDFAEDFLYSEVVPEEEQGPVFGYVIDGIALKYEAEEDKDVRQS